MSFRRLGVVTAAIGLAVAAAPLSPAGAAGVACGDTITVSTALTQDLTCDGTTDALIIGANNITLDLKGHKITGPGAYVGIGSGVRATQRTGVVVTNGEIRGFRSGVVFNESWGSTASKLRVVANDQGINLAGGGDHQVVKNVAEDNGRDGIVLGLSTRNRISQNTVFDNHWGITVASISSDNLVDRNVIYRNDDTGVAAFGNATDTTIAQNDTSGNYDGIRVNPDAPDTVLLQNKAYLNSDDGIDVDTTSATITKNTATYNGDLGIEAVAGVTDGGGNKAGYNGNPLQCTVVVCEPVS